MALTRYQRKRHFRVTPEPAGRIAASLGWAFVVQKHAATRLHYDFRLELDGVLKSWAVPKGPSLDPTVRRLAVEVEDHPVEYKDFEGIIPEGEYGGGTVMIWDQGTWEPIGDPLSGYRTGKLKFHLDGQKLQGVWTLVRTKSSHQTSSRNASATSWLLMKVKDSSARSRGDILKSDRSVVSGRSLDEIAAARERVWTGAAEGPADPAPRSPRSSKAKPRSAVTPRRGGRNPANPLPSDFEVQLATLTREAPRGEEWLHEIKFDGYRMICLRDRDRVTFQSRNHQDWTHRLGSSLLDAVKRLPARQIVLDGEVVVLGKNGTTDFQALQNAFRDQQSQDLRYVVFDLLALDGKRLTALPLEQRKERLARLVAELPPDSPVQYSDHVAGHGAEFQQQACRMHLEGTVSKRRDQPYRSGRGVDWLKVKCVHKDEFVIGGYTDPGGSRTGFGALLMGYYDRGQRLCYAGKVGTGFDEAELEMLSKRLRALEQPRSPFSDQTTRTGPARTAHWVEPTLVAQISYGSRTRDGYLRHAVYAGLREDKPAEEVKMDHAIPVDQATAPPVSPSDGKAGTARRSRARPPEPMRTRTPEDSEYNPDDETFAGVRLTHPEKVLDADSGVTKLDLARYYHDIADWILPHLVHRPLVLVRCPDGHHKQCFYQKHPGAGMPDSLRRIPIEESQKTGNYLVIDDVAGLVALAQAGALELHAWGAREDRLERPDRLILDLDPSPEVEWEQVVEGAREIREFLEALGLESFVKTTGGKGLHLVMPIERRHDWDEVKSFCHDLADAIVAAASDRYTANMSKAARSGKIFVDYLRNGRGATAIVPYSTRAREGTPVSTPLRWDELSPDIRSDHFHIGNLRARLNSLRADPWEGLDSLRQRLAGPMKKLRSVTAGLSANS